MEVNYDDYTAFVQPDEAPINDVPIYSKMASKRTVAKYLKRKGTMSKLIAKDPFSVENIKLENNENKEKSGKLDFDLSKMGNSISYFNEHYGQELAPLIFSPNFIGSNNMIQDNKENNSSISDMLKCVLDSNKGFMDVLEKCNEFSNTWLPNGIPFDFCQSQLTGSSLSASIDKQEREIAYNLLLRRIIDEALDRSVIFSHQPKELLNHINNILIRQFPEYDESKHRSKVRSYLKACRRNSKKNNGKILMKNTAAYLSSGPGNRLMHQIYSSEKETIDLIKKESEKFRLSQNGKHSQAQLQAPTSSVPVTTNQLQTLLSIPTNTLPTLLPVSIHPIQSTVKQNTQIYTSKTPISMNQLPLLLPLTTNNVNASHTESVKKSNNSSEQNLSEDVVKNISEIVRSLVNTDCNVNLSDLITQLYSTANFLEKFAKSLEKFVNGPGK